MRPFKFLKDNNIENHVLYVEMTDVNTGEHFGIPANMREEICRLGLNLFHSERTTSGRCDYYPFEYWVDRIYRTVTDLLVIDAIISAPFGDGNGRVTFFRVRETVPLLPINLPEPVSEVAD